MPSIVTAAPQYISWNYTYACNFNCSHCYSRAPWYPKELGTEEYRQIVAQIADAKVFKVGFGGGEPLIRRDCYEIASLLAKKGVNVNITTNGWFVNQDIAKRLADSGLAMLYVSLDSADRESHDTFRRRVGSYDRVMRCLEAAAAVKLPVTLSTVISNVNITDLHAIVGIGEHYQVAGVEFKRYRPAGNGAINANTLQPLQKNTMITETIADLQKKSRLHITLVYGDQGEGVDEGCPCGKRSICLRPNGDLSPCAYGDSVIGNLMQDSLTHIWQTSPELQAMRQGGGCVVSSSPHHYPSNPLIQIGGRRSESLL